MLLEAARVEDVKLIQAILPTKVFEGTDTEQLLVGTNNTTLFQAQGAIGDHGTGTLGNTIDPIRSELLKTLETFPRPMIKGLILGM